MKISIDHLRFATKRAYRREIVKRLAAERGSELVLDLTHDADRRCCSIQSERRVGAWLYVALLGRGVRVVAEVTR
ncbi:hypothetical protein EPN29_01900 [bacterium]|nr:MAG: hypothetical protein EPN29_01900 [bacterium]